MLTELSLARFLRLVRRKVPTSLDAQSVSDTSADAEREGIAVEPARGAGASPMESPVPKPVVRDDAGDWTPFVGATARYLAATAAE